MHIILIEPDTKLVVTLTNALQSKGFTVAVAHDAANALRLLDQQVPDCFVIEPQLSTHSGFELLYEIRSYSEWQQVPIIIFSNILFRRDIRASEAWKQLGIADYIYKPDGTLLYLIEKLVEAWHDKKEHHATSN